MLFSTKTNEFRPERENQMSNYCIKVRNKETGEVRACACVDDFFGQHNYGYMVENVDKVLTGDEIEKDWEMEDE